MVIQSYERRVQGGTAFLFPGQGSHQVGMSADLYRTYGFVKDFFKQVDEAVNAPLMRIAFEGPEDELRKTVNAQPAIMAVSLACLLVMQNTLEPERFPHPAFTAGHSLGEYTALVAAGALEPLDAIRLVRERGRLMHEASLHRDGTMAAIIGLEEDVLEEVCRETGAEIANVNSAEQTVISGERQAVGRAMDLATARGAKRAILLQVGGAFHSSLMEPAVEGMARVLEGVTIKAPEIPVVANCTGLPITSPDEVRKELAAQIRSCVQWRRSMSYLLGAGITRFVEIGPGRVLSGLVRRMSRDVDVVAVSDASTVKQLATT